MKHDLFGFTVLAVLAIAALANGLATLEMRDQVKHLTLCVGRLPEVVEVERPGCPCGKTCRCCPCKKEAEGGDRH